MGGCKDYSYIFRFVLDIADHASCRPHPGERQHGRREGAGHLHPRQHRRR